MPRTEGFKRGHGENWIVLAVPIQRHHGGTGRVVSRTDHGVSLKTVQNGKRIPVDLNTTAREVISAYTAIPVEEEISRHHVTRDVDDHGIVGVARSGVELNGDGTEHDFLLVIHVHGNAKACGFGGHHVLTAKLFTQTETSGDVVCVCVGGNGVNKLQSLRVEQRSVVVHEIVDRVNQGRFFGGFVHDQIGHGPDALVQLFKSHGESQPLD